MKKLLTTLSGSLTLCFMLIVFASMGNAKTIYVETSGFSPSDGWGLWAWNDNGKDGFVKAVKENDLYKLSIDDAYTKCHFISKQPTGNNWTGVDKWLTDKNLGDIAANSIHILKKSGNSYSLDDPETMRFVGAQWSNWSTTAGPAFTYKGDGLYEIENLQLNQSSDFKIYYKNSYYSSADDSGNKEFKTTEDQTLTTGGKNMYTLSNINHVKIRVNSDGSLTSLKIVDAPEKVYLYMNDGSGWSQALKNPVMSFAWDNNNNKYNVESGNTPIKITSSSFQFFLSTVAGNENNTTDTFTAENSYLANTTNANFANVEIVAVKHKPLDSGDNNYNFFHLNNQLGTITSISLTYSNGQLKIKANFVERIEAPEKLYVLGNVGGKWDLKNPLVTFTWNEDTGKYEADDELRVDDNTTLYFVLSSKLSALANSEDFAGISGCRYGAGKDADITSESDLKIATEGAYYLSSGVYSIDITWKGTGAANKIKATKIVVKDYYLTGDINNWVTLDNQDLIPAGESLAGNYKFSYDSDGWYQLYIKSMHGQFQIITKGWNDEHYGSNFGQFDGNGVFTDVNDEYWSNKISNSMPVAQNVRSISGKDKSLGNLHLDHNYYDGARIRFNPSKKLLYIDADGYRDLYVYCYNDGISTAPTIQLGNYNLNEDNYHLEITEAQFEKVMYEDWTELEKNNTTLSRRNIPYVYRARLYPGVEEENYTYVSGEKKPHYFYFTITNSGLSIDNTRVTVDGTNKYYLNDIRIALQVLANVADDNAGEPLLLGEEIEQINYRLIDIDEATGKYFYVADPTKTTKALTNDIREALTHKMTAHMDFSDYQEVIANYLPSATHKHGFHYKPSEGKNSVVALDETVTNWYDGMHGLDLKHSNMHVEFEVARKAAPGDSEGAVEYFSDFKHTTKWDDDHGNVSSVEDYENFYENDRHIINLQPMSEVDPDQVSGISYKLNGDHMFISVPSDVPTGIRGIEVDDNDAAQENTKVEYFNLMGMKVERPVKGQIYIRIAGGKSSKVLY